MKNIKELILAAGLGLAIPVISYKFGSFCLNCSKPNIGIAGIIPSPENINYIYLIYSSCAKFLESYVFVIPIIAAFAIIFYLIKSKPFSKKASLFFSYLFLFLVFMCIGVILANFFL